MEALIAEALWALIEVMIQVLSSLGSLPSMERKTVEPNSAALGSFVWFNIGIALGICWALILPYFVLQSPHLRLANLAIAPFLSGAIARLISLRRQRVNHNIILEFTSGFRTGLRLA